MKNKAISTVTKSLPDFFDYLYKSLVFNRYGVFLKTLKYNNPHKISLYLSQGLPVIVWKESALSDFVIKHSIGIVIDNLEELNHVLNSLPYEEYLRLVKNVEPIQKNLISGFYFRKAFDQALTKIANHHN